MRIAHIARLAAMGVLTIGFGLAMASCQRRTQQPQRVEASSAGDDSEFVAAPTLDRGGIAYLAYCGMCHGSWGAGDGPLASDFKKQGARPPGGLDDRHRLDELGRDGIIEIIRKGGQHTGRSNLMPPWSESLDPALTRGIADHVLTLRDSTPSSKADVVRLYLSLHQGAPARGRELFVFHCTACHGPQGRGDGPLAASLWTNHRVRPSNLTDSIYFARKSDRELIATLSLGGGHVGKSKFMPAWNYTFPAAQIKDLIGYVRAISHTRES
jgi:mono/diheme cytochrome c family protein